MGVVLAALGSLPSRPGPGLITRALDISLREILVRLGFSAIGPPIAPARILTAGAGAPSQDEVPEF